MLPSAAVRDARPVRQRASRSRHDAYQTPVHGLPPDLVRADLGQFIPKLKGERISGKVSGHALVPYATRKEINAASDAPVLFYTDDAVAFFFLQIQGSGRVVFDDGSAARIGYAGENGRPYTAIGRTLIAEGALSRENVSLQTIRAWLLANPARAQSVMEGNESYIFFGQKPLGDVALGSTGALGVALTPGASMAVDPRIHALGAPFYLEAGGPDPVRGLLVAQDIGGAIRGISEMTSSVASAIEEQTATTNEMGRNVSDAAQGSEQIAGGIETVAQSAASSSQVLGDVSKSVEELNSLADDLRSRVSSFTY